MNLGKIIKKSLGLPARSAQQSTPAPRPLRRSELDIIFTRQFQEKAAQWGLTEDHARLVFWEGDFVMQDGKLTNMKVMPYKGGEIGIYVFRDEQTNQPVVTSIWKRQLRGAKPDKSR